MVGAGGGDGGLDERDPFRFLSSWFRSQWGSGQVDSGAITIEAADGPGWWVTIDLRRTSLEGRSLEPAVVDLGIERWIQYWADGRTFTVATSAFELDEGVDVFRNFVRDAHADTTHEPESI